MSRTITTTVELETSVALNDSIRVEIKPLVKCPQNVVTANVNSFIANNKFAVNGTTLAYDQESKELVCDLSMKKDYRDKADIRYDEDYGMRGKDREVKDAFASKKRAEAQNEFNTSLSSTKTKFDEYYKKAMEFVNYQAILYMAQQIGTVEGLQTVNGETEFTINIE